MTIEASAAAWSAEADLDGAIVDLVAREAVPVPPSPAIAARVERLVAEGDWRVEELVRLVSSDPALAGAALRAADLRRGRGGEVVSIPAAAERLGPHRLASVALRAIREAGRGTGPLSALRRQVWRDAVSSAILSRELAVTRGLDPDEAYACGLLHDAGRLLAIALLERLARGAREGRAMPARWWEAVVERYHVRLGMALAERWRLPRPIRECIERHHHERVDETPAADFVSAVAAADAVVRVLADDGRVDDEDAASIRALTQRDTDALARMVDRLPWILSSLERDPGPAAAPAERPRASERPPGVRLRIADAEYEAVGFAPRQLLVRGDVPLPEELLLEVELDGDVAVRFHARVLLCWPEGGRFGAVLMPFALTGPALLHWQGLVAHGVASG